MMQRVIVLEQGFTWNGKVYASLSMVARAITGTRWNGYRFFSVGGGPKGSFGGDWRAAAPDA